MWLVPDSARPDNCSEDKLPLFVAAFAGLEHRWMIRRGLLRIRKINLQRNLSDIELLPYLKRVGVGDFQVWIQGSILVGRCYRAPVNRTV
jgi:hypothetical protein